MKNIKTQLIMPLLCLTFIGFSAFTEEVQASSSLVRLQPVEEVVLQARLR